MLSCFELYPRWVPLLGSETAREGGGRRVLFLSPSRAQIPLPVPFKRLPRSRLAAARCSKQALVCYTAVFWCRHATLVLLV